MSRTWYSIKAAARAGAAEVSIHDEIGYFGISAKDFLRDLRGLGDLSEINLSIHSPGGEVFDGWAIFNALRAHKATVNVRIEGLAASMASVIAMAGDTVTIPKNAYLMIHNPWGVAVGDAGDMRELAELLDKLQGNILNAYEEKTGLERDELKSMMDAETWMDGTEAVQRGFADALADEVALSALAFDTRRFAKAPASILTPMNNDDSPAPGAAPVEPPAPAAAPPAPAATPPTGDAPPPEPAPAGDPAPPAAAPVEPPAPEARGFLERIAAAFSGDTALKAQVTAHEATITRLNAEIAALTPKAAAHDALIAQVSELEKKQKTIGQAAAELAATHGLTPEAQAQLPAPTSEVETTPTMPRAEFNKLSHPDRNAFMKKGGKLVD